MRSARTAVMGFLILLSPALLHADGPAIHIESFHMGYGRIDEPVTARDYIKDTWMIRLALAEAKLDKPTTQAADDRLKAAAEQLIPLWRQSEQNPPQSDQINAKAAKIWAAVENDLKRILGGSIEPFKDRLLIVFLQELVVPCPDTVWGAEDFMHLNLTERQKHDMDEAFSDADQRCDKASEEFSAAIANDPSQILPDRVEKLRRLRADRRHQVRSRLTVDQLEKWDSYILSEMKKSAAQDAK